MVTTAPNMVWSSDLGFNHDLYDSIDVLTVSSFAMELGFHSIEDCTLYVSCSNRIVFLVLLFRAKLRVVNIPQPDDI